MSKFVTINYYIHFTYDNKTVCYGDGDINKPFKITLNIDSIMSIVDKSRTCNIYENCNSGSTGAYIPKNVYLLQTNNAGIDRGTNFYFITEESYRKLIRELDPVQCN